MLLALLWACVADDRRVELVWFKGHDDETWEQARAGLWWSLSNLGARPDVDDGLASSGGDDLVRFSLDLDRVGLTDDALDALEPALADLRPPTDVGRLLMLSLYDPWRYYAITGACDDLDGWRGRLRDAERFAVTDSLLVEGHREITFSPLPQGTAEVAFLAAEGPGSLPDGSFEPVEHETVDVMPNGQQRYAVYGPDGQLAPAASHAPAGQPGRCMWCHEMRIQPGLSSSAPIDGYVSHDRFLATVAAADAVMQEARAAMAPVMDVEAYAVHTWAERVALSFLEPSAARVAREWGVTEAEAREALAGLPVHTSEEYPQLGPLYRRADVDGLRGDEQPAVLGSSRDAVFVERPEGMGMRCE